MIAGISRSCLGVCRIDYTATARTQLRKLDRNTARRILDYMDERVAPLADPRSVGHKDQQSVFENERSGRHGPPANLRPHDRSIHGLLIPTTTKATVHPIAGVVHPTV